MQAPTLHKIQQHNFWLSAERCIFWEDQKSLIVSDLHIGKTGHFRKAGIAVPQNVFKEDLQRLLDLVKFFNAKKLIVVGDLFHSHANLELDLFKKWRRDVPFVELILVKGNHDILKSKWYDEAEIKVCKDSLIIDNIHFTHHKCNEYELFTFCGHLHPGIILNGLGKQSLRFPCFYFTKDNCILPAFSKFTGMMNINSREKAEIFAIVENRLIKV